MKKWPAGEIRRIERAYSPKRRWFGYYMLGSFIHNVPDAIEIVMRSHVEPIVLVQLKDDKTFRVVGKYYYENIPVQYQDDRGQYPSPYKTMPDWKCDFGMVTGFPLRPWIRIPVPCGEAEYHDLRTKERYMTWASTKCESPIEKMFMKHASKRGLLLRPQWWIRTNSNNYRVDFADVQAKIAIEIDGHDFHSSKEQRTHDAQRERALQSIGWKVIRFTGSEIFSNPIKCIEELITILHV